MSMPDLSDFPMELPLEAPNCVAAMARATAEGFDLPTRQAVISANIRALQWFEFPETTMAPLVAILDGLQRCTHVVKIADKTEN